MSKDEPYLYGNAEDWGLKLLDEVADEEVGARARRAVRRGTHRWIWDPEVINVVGLVPCSSSKVAVIICYLARDDFECDDKWLYG